MRKATAHVATMRANSKLPAGIYRLVTEEEEIPGLSFVAFAPACVVICEGFIGRFPRNKGFRNFSKFALGKSLGHGELRRKRGPLGEMAEFCSRCGFDEPRMVRMIDSHYVGVRTRA